MTHSGQRLKKPPTRGQIAHKIKQLIPIINEHTQGFRRVELDLKELAGNVSALSDILRTTDTVVEEGRVAFLAHIHASRWQRIKWVLGF